MQVEDAAEEAKSAEAREAEEQKVCKDREATKGEALDESAPKEPGLVAETKKPSMDAKAKKKAERIALEKRLMLGVEEKEVAKEEPPEGQVAGLSTQNLQSKLKAA